MKNYNFIKKEFINEINTNASIYEHAKTKAKICILENDDNNKVFTIGFRTPAPNSTGLTHILEHSVLCGSKKYPVKEPFVELLKGSLQTFLNAMTYPDKTVYPVASCNDNDFNNLISVYMDAVFNPNIYDMKEIFMQEGWHYKLENIEDDITINGVVYNEMKGATSSVDDVMFRSILASLNPDTTYKHNSGGDPINIPDLSYEEFLDYHKNYYHPSNSYIIIYGDCNMEDKLKFIDEEYLSKYEYSNFDTSIKPQSPYDKMNVLEKEYPISKDDKLENKTNISLNYQIGRFDDAKLNLAFELLISILIYSDSSYLKKALLEANICEDVSGMFMDGIYNSFLSIVIKNSNKENNDVFKEIVNNTLVKLVKDGIDKDMLSSSISYCEFKLREDNNGTTPKGIDASLKLFSTWLYDNDNQLSPLKYIDLLDELKEEIKTDYFEQLIVKYILNNNHTSNVICVPSHTIADKRESDLKEKLFKYKQSLSVNDLNIIKDSTIKLQEYQDAPVSQEALDTIPKLTKDEISLEVEELNSELVDVNGYKVYKQDYFTSNINYLQFKFDISNINNDDLPYVKLLTSLLGRLNTTNKSLLELENLEKQYTGGIGFVVGVINKIDKTYLPTITVSTSFLKENLNNALELLIDMRDNSILDANKLKEIMLEQRNRLKMIIANSGHIFAVSRINTYFSESHYFEDKLSGLGYLDFLENTLDNFDNNVDAILGNIKLIKDTYFTKENMFMVYSGSEFEVAEESLNIFTTNLIDKFTCTNKFTYTPTILNEGIKTTSNVQYVARGGNYSDKFKYNGSIEVLKSILSKDYLWQEVRVKGGAYGCMVISDINGNFTFTSYRDPNIKKTSDTYLSSIDYIKSINLSDDELLKIIIGTIAAIDTPSHVSVKAMKAFSLNIRGITHDMLCKQRNEIINTNNEQLKELAKYVDFVLNKDIYCVVGNEKNIEENKDFFKSIRKI